MWSLGTKIEVAIKNATAPVIWVFMAIFVTTCGIAMMCIEYRKQLSVDDPQVVSELCCMLEKDFPNCEFDDFCIHPTYMDGVEDTILSLHPNLELRDYLYDSGYDNIKAILYHKIDGTDTTICCTYFETKVGFLKDELVKPLLHITDSVKLCEHFKN